MDRSDRRLAQENVNREYLVSGIYLQRIGLPSLAFVDALLPPRTRLLFGKSRRKALLPRLALCGYVQTRATERRPRTYFLFFRRDSRSRSSTRLCRAADFSWSRWACFCSSRDSLIKAASFSLSKGTTRKLYAAPDTNGVSRCCPARFALGLTRKIMRRPASAECRDL
jgi:hypothetical protein